VATSKGVVSPAVELLSVFLGSDLVAESGADFSQPAKSRAVSARVIKKERRLRNTAQTQRGKAATKGIGTSTLIASR
jgi:hypothetical protein